MIFDPFPKISRLSRECVITEKIDGTSGTIFIDDSGGLLVGSRNRWVTPEADNYGFAKWALGNREELLKLGPGWHRGEWWGSGIQRRYGLNEKRFSLFNVLRWVDSHEPGASEVQDREVAPHCCHVVPILVRGIFDTGVIEDTLGILAEFGSRAAPNFMQPEGIVIYHTAAKVLFKKTIVGDEKLKGSNE